MKNLESIDAAETFGSRGPIFGNKVPARYFPSADPMFRHNPLIEALPPIMAVDEFTKAASWYPAYDEEERKKPLEYRLIASERIKTLVEPLPPFVRFYYSLCGQLRFGYLSRNPPRPAYKKQLEESFPDKEFSEDPYRMPVLQNAASGSCVLGISGVGKTTLIETVLKLIPQVIIHSEYENEQFTQQQLVWAYVCCFRGKTLKNIAFQFLYQVELLLGYPCFSNCHGKRWAEKDILMEMARVARTVKLGALVVDEVQNLQYGESKTGQQRRGYSYPPSLLTALVTFSNLFRVPIVFVGTPETGPLIGKSMPLSRRATQGGKIEVDRLRPGRVWDQFYETLSRYQFQKKPMQDNDEIKKAFYEETQGIIGALVSLFTAVQWEAIYSGVEAISEKLIREVARTHLGPLYPWIRLIKAGKEKFFSTPQVLESDLSHEAFVAASKRNTRSAKDQNGGERANERGKSNSAGRENVLTASKDARAKKRKKAKENYEKLKRRGLIADGERE